MSIRKASQLTTNNSFSVSKPAIGGLLQPYISNVIYTDSSYVTLDDTAVNTLGGYVRILGNNFLSGLSLYVNGLQVSPSNITVYSNTEIRALLPATSAGSYSLMVFNNNNAGTMLYNGLVYSPFPSYTGATALFGVTNIFFTATLTASGDTPFNFYLTSGSLPTGLTLASSTGLISGTPTGYLVLTTGSFIINVDDAQSQTTTITITWTIAPGDTYYPTTPLLLTADPTVQTKNFLSDGSLNNLQLTPAGSVRAQSFNPYQFGYYGVSFDGSSYLTIPDSNAFTLSTNNFTIECWLYSTVAGAAQYFSGQVNSAAATSSWSFSLAKGAGNTLGLTVISGSTVYDCPSVATISLNTWTHFAAVRDGTTLRVYINGVQSATTAISTASINDSSNLLAIGRLGEYASNYFYGYISNYRLVNGTCLYPSGTTFTPNTTPLTAITNTSLLTCQNASYIDNSPYALTLTPNGTVKIASANPFTTPSSITVNTGYSTYFGGSGYITTASNSQFIASTNGFTVEAWVFYTAISNYTFIVASTTGTNNYNPYWYIGSTNTSTWRVSWGDATSVDTGVAIVLNTWYHVAMSMSSSGSGVFYVNGVSKATATGKTLNGSATGVVIADGGGSIAGSYPLSGYVSNVRYVSNNSVYTGAFTPSTTPLTAITNTVLLTCQGSQIVDSSTNAFTLTLSGSPKVVNNTYPFTQTTATLTSVTTLGSGYFDGSTAYVTLPGTNFAFGTGNFTIEFWTYIIAPVTNAAVFYDQRTATATVAPLIQMYTSNILYYGVGASNQITGPALVVGQWYHIAVSRVSGSTRMFLNGTQVGSTYSDSNSYVAQSNRPILGSYGDTVANRFNGYLSDLRVINGTGFYSSNFAPPINSNTAITNTQLLTLQTNVAHNSDTINDSSSFNSINQISRFGDTNSGTFSPYGDNFSVYFNGSSYIQTSTNTPLGAGDFTLELFIYPTAYPSVNAMLYGYRNGADTSPYLFFGSTGVMTFGGDITNILVSSAGTILLNVWQHIAIVRSGVGTNNMAMFVNGTRVAQGTSVTNFSYASGTDIAVMNITPYYYTGYMSNLRTVCGSAVYTTAATISVPTSPLLPITNTGFLLFQSNRLIDNSPNPYALIITGPPQIQKFSPFSLSTVSKYYSTIFDGSGYATIGTSSALNLSGSWTIEAWIYPTALTGASMAIFSNLNNGTTNGGFIFALSGATQIYITSQNPSSVSANTTSSFTLLNYNWYHIAAVSVSGTVSFYLNGVLQTSTGSILSSIPNNYTNYIGGNANGSFPYRFPGYINNLRIVNGTAVYTGSSFTVPTTPLTAITNTALLTFQNNTIVDNSVNNFAISPSTNAIKPLPFSPFTVTVSNVQTYSPTIYGGSIYFNGSSDYLSFPTAPISTTGDFTAEAWVYPTGGSDGTIFYFYGNSSSYAGVRLGFGSAIPGFYILLSQNGTAWALNSSNSIGGYVPNNWTHIALTRSGTTGKVFVNGLPTYTFTWGTLYAGTVNQIGSLINSSQTIFFTGYMSNVRVTNGVALYNNTNFYPPTNILTSTSATTLLLNGTSNGIVNTSRDSNLESFGTARVANFSPYNGNYYSVLFNGSTDYLTIANSAPANAAMNFSTNSFTIECWLYLTSYGGANYAPIFANQYMFYIGSAGQVLYYNGSSNVVTGTSGDVSLNVWTHLACVRNVTTVTIYVNGVSKATATVSASISYGGSYAASIGNNSTVYLQGYLSNLRVINGTAVYTSAFTPSTTPLTQTQLANVNGNPSAAIVSGTALLTCQSNKFIDNSVNVFTITSNGTPKVQTQNPFQTNTGLGYFFNGSTDYLSTPYSLFYALEATDFTIEGWVYRNVIGAEHNIAVTRSSTDGWNLRINATNTLQFYYTGGSSLTSTGTILSGSWYYVAATRSGTTVRLYINGSLDSSSTFSNGTANSSAMRIGVDNTNASGFMNGYITDLRITKGSARYITSAFVIPNTPNPIK